MTFREPIRPRRQLVDYTICSMPSTILAVVRMTYYKNGKPCEVDEVRIYQDGQNGYDAFAYAVQGALIRGANVSIRSQYQPDELGFC